jgi:chromosomal replication initiation ATPase DnaA
MNNRGKQTDIGQAGNRKGVPVFGDIHAMALQRQIEKSVSNAFQVPERELRARTRRKAHTAFARQVAMYLAHVGCGMSYSEVGRLFGRDRTTAAHACRLIEDRRDDPGLDLSLDHLEQAVRHWADRRIMHS